MRSLGEDATLGDVLWMLDKHYGIVVTFHAISFIPSSRKWEKMWLSLEYVCFKQVQILQTEYLSRTQQELMEKVKWDHFYKGLSPEYWQMLAQKVNGENHVTYSKLLLAAQKLESQAESRDPLLLKTPTTRSSNVTHSHLQGNLFPSRKLEGNCTFTAQSAAVEDHEMEGDTGPNPMGRKGPGPLLRRKWKQQAE